MDIKCLVIRKVSGNKTIVYSGRTTTEIQPAPQAAPKPARASVAVDVSNRVPWTNENVRVVHVTESTPEPAQQKPHLINVEALLKILKPLPKKKNSYIEIRGNAYPVKTLYDMAKLAEYEVFSIAIQDAHEFHWYEYGKYRNDPTIDKSKITPALIIRHGNTKTTLIPSAAAPDATVWEWAI